MKKLTYLFFCLSIAAFGQNTVTDIDGNTYNYLTFGDQKWTTENAAMETYRDGTPIPQVTDTLEWENLTTGAWCYLNNDPNTEVKLYNWFAVVGIHDTDPNTPNKELAPEGWNVPSLDDWISFENYLIDNGYNYDGSTTDNKIAKAMASSSGWNASSNEGDPGNDQSSNNSSGFNAFPFGYKEGGIISQGQFVGENNIASFWTTTESNNVLGYYLQLMNGFPGSITSDSDEIWKQGGMSVRFLKGAYTLIPDPNFEQALIDQDIDTNPIIDGQVLTAAISGLLELSVQSLQIADLTGIEDFTALTNLSCDSNELTSLDLTNNTALTNLSCSGNELTSLDLTNNTALTILVCYVNELTSLDVSNNTDLTDLLAFNNQLTSLDVSNNTLLQLLDIGDNPFSGLNVNNNTALVFLLVGNYSNNGQLTNLDVSNNTALTFLTVRGNQLTSIDVSNNTALSYLNCSANQLTSIDVSNNTALETFYIYENQLTSLDVNNNSDLTIFQCYNSQLTSLDVRNGNNYSFSDFRAEENSDLSCIYVDDADYSNANWTDIDPNSTFVENEAECEVLGESYCKEMNVIRLLDSDNEVVTFEISTDEWHYLAITKSDDLTGKIYLDGNLVGEGAFLDVDYNWSQLYLGVSYFTSWRKHFKGWLDEFRVSSVVRTEQEILENFEANTSLELDDNTLGLWHLDEPDGNFFNNSVPGMDDGELFSGAQFTDGRFGNSVYFDGIDDRGDCYTNIPESNVTFEIWLKIQGEEEQENVITPFEAYGLYNTSSDVFDNCDLILDGSSTEINSISIYPNPTNNYLFIEGNINPVAISIYNLLGIEVISTKNTDKVDVSELSKGIYIIKISDGKNLTNKKFIKN